MGTLRGQRGSIVATATIVLAGVAIVAGFTIAAVERSVGVSGQQREHAQALHAAEAGVSAAAAFLRQGYDATNKWTAYVAAPDGAGNPTPVTPAGIAGNGIPPGTAGNPFDAGALAWYEVSFLNNTGDPGFGAAQDQDGVITIRAIGHGPDSARVVLEVQVKGTAPLVPVTRLSWREVAL